MALVTRFEAVPDRGLVVAAVVETFFLRSMAMPVPVPFALFLRFGGGGAPDCTADGLVAFTGLAGAGARPSDAGPRSSPCPTNLARLRSSAERAQAASPPALDPSSAADMSVAAEEAEAEP